MGSCLDSNATDNLFDRDMISVLVTNILNLGRMWMDVFILAVNFKDWIKKRYVSLTDRILTLQASIRICYGCMAVLWHFLAKFCPWVTQREYIFKVFMFSIWFFISCNVWLTASLCSYYCLKIADFRHPTFICLKLRLSGLVSTWLLGSMVLSLASSLPYVFSDLEIQGSFFRNKNVTDIYQKRMALHVIALLGLGCFAAFTICATSAILLLFSLWRHHQRMMGSWSGHGSPKTNAHIQSLIVILSLLVNNIIIFISVVVILWIEFAGNSVANIAAIAVLYSCFSVETLISIWGNKKLKNELRKAFKIIAHC